MQCSAEQLSVVEIKAAVVVVEVKAKVVSVLVQNYFKKLNVSLSLNSF